MQRTLLVVVLAAFCFSFYACSDKISTEEAKVLVSLDEIQRGFESNISYDDFLGLLNTAKAEIGMLKKSSQKKDPCFINAVEKCASAYAIAGKAWKKKNEMVDGKRKQDMDMALSFSLSFAALSIQKAGKCYP